jgi:predicted Zn-dependent protease
MHLTGQKQKSPWQLTAAIVVIAVGLSGCGWRKTLPPPPPPPPAKAAVELPPRIIVAVHENAVDMVDVEALTARLRMTFAMPVETSTVRCDYSKAYDGGRRQYFAPEVLDCFYDWRWARDKNLRFFIVADDIFTPEVKYWFAHSNTATRSSVIALKGLVEGTRNAADPLRSKRVGTFLVRNVARLSAKLSSDCLLKPVNSLKDLDQLPQKFCPGDRAVLEDVGLMPRGG